MASITKTSSEDKVPQPLSLLSPKKLRRSMNTPLNLQKNSRSKIHVLSTSPLSATSTISFLSTDSHSSGTWTPSRKSPRLRNQKKLPPKIIALNKGPLKVKQRSTPSKSQPKVSPKTKRGMSTLNKTNLNTRLKSIHKAKNTAKNTQHKKKAMLITCAVRKKAEKEEPRNEAGLTVDEILMSVANHSIPQEQPSKPDSPKLNNPKRKKVLPPPSFKTVKHKLKAPPKITPSQSTHSPITPKRTPKLPSPKEKSTTNKSLTKLSKKLKGSPPKSLVLTSQPDTTALEESQSCVPREGSGKTVISTSPNQQSPNSFSYQAQRKFASNQSPPTRPINQELASPLGLKETPKTEDFLHFLCLRGSNFIPEHLKKFEFPWTPTQESSATGNKTDKPAVGLNLTAKKLDFMSRMSLS
ncbi:neurofilament heavy polypeptide-like isoform X2 [Halichondria panicea]